MPQIKHIPTIANWLAQRDGARLLGRAEFPLFTDAWLTGEISLGPYEFLNTVAGSNSKVVKLGIVLRYSMYKDREYPDLNKSDTALYHGGEPPEELAAFASMVLGIRLRAGRSIRRFEVGGDPLGHPEEIGDQSEPNFVSPRIYNLPSAKGQHSLDELNLLTSLLTLPSSAVIALARAARLYQDALWLAESEPELTWLLLVSAVEAIANEWNKEHGDDVLRLEISKPELHKFLSDYPDKSLLNRVAHEFSDSLGITRKFVDFCMTFVGGPPSKRPAEWAQFNWADEELRRALKLVYNYRSKALHKGIPFPAPMCSPPYKEPTWDAPAERIFGLAIHQKGSTWLEKDLPMSLHLFEYLARSAILAWWRCQITEGADSK